MRKAEKNIRYISIFECWHNPLYEWRDRRKRTLCSPIFDIYQFITYDWWTWFSRLFLLEFFRIGFWHRLRIRTDHWLTSGSFPAIPVPFCIPLWCEWHFIFLCFVRTDVSLSVLLCWCWYWSIRNKYVARKLTLASAYDLLLIYLLSAMLILEVTKIFRISGTGRKQRNL